ncbi:alpha-hydroxy acid oxidase [Bartonella sp. HY406]|uniref:alpha-hydroxy acid oxidase n=1 Tax=Bartonella sp. HY406 TaxID=2979331 RepID=UPI0021C85715|nr:alpha-hydroxy acid oxidase [Bartonella sp. HY406]UXN03589.1 alpha-hydroxy-acid oxidizing protein [Bartonella sp. HY406]
MKKLLNFHDYRQAAKRKLPRFLFEYIDRGSEDEHAICNLHNSFSNIRLTPKILQGIDNPDLSTQYFNKNYNIPLIIAPTALAGIVAVDGEVKLARSAGKLGIPFTVSTQSVTTIEDIRQNAAETELWFQLYMWRNRKLTQTLLERVWNTGVSTLMVTVDTPISPKREYNQKNGFSIPFRPSLRSILDILGAPHWLFFVLLQLYKRNGMPSYGHYPEEFRHNIMSVSQNEELRIEDKLNWSDVEKLRTTWKGQIILKGILSPNDAQKALALGMDGIVVSAHGGRNFDSAVTPIDVLEPIIDKMGEKLAIFADSGVRRGSDIAKLLSFGVKAVLLGRAPLWGLAGQDEKGSMIILQLLIEELQQTMIMLGCKNIEDLPMSRNAQK